MASVSTTLAQRLYPVQMLLSTMEANVFISCKRASSRGTNVGPVFLTDNHTPASICLLLRDGWNF